MDNTFNINRFLLLVQRIWIENKKLFLILTAVLAGLLTITYFFLSTGNNQKFPNYPIFPSIEIRNFIFIIISFLGGAKMANLIFKEFSDRSTTKNVLLIPASHLEKIVCGLLYSFVIFPIIYFSIFLVIDATSFQLVQNSLKNLNSPITFVPLFYGRYFLIWVLTISFTIACTMYFTPNSFVKTIATAIIILLIIYFSAPVIWNLVPGQIKLIETIGSASAEVDVRQLGLRAIGGPMLPYFSILSIPFLLIAYFKLKEKQA